MLLAWVETEEDLTAIHNAAKVSIFEMSPIFDKFNVEDGAKIVFMKQQLSEHERLLDHSQPGVCQRVLEERAHPGGFLKFERAHPGGFLASPDALEVIVVSHLLTYSALALT